jgi:glyoxylase-like metal-dependent hydrolase (beta-lactamase superfamily II)
MTAITVAPALAAAPAQDEETRDGTSGDPAARATLERALAALGGAERIASPSAWIVEGRGRENLSAENQGVSPAEPTWRPHEERVAVDGAALAVSWERRTPRNDESLRFRRFVWRADSTGVFDWTVSRGSMRAAPNPEEKRRAIARRVPHLLVAEAASRASRLTSLAPRTIDGAACDVVAADLPGAPARLELALGKEPAVLREVAYTTRFPGFGDVRVAWRWTGWRADQALGFVPRGHTVTVGDATYQEVEYTRYAASAEAAAAAELLSVPRSGARPASGSAPPRDLAAELSAHQAPQEVPATGEVAPGVHVFDAAGFTCGWVDVGDFVVAFEAPESSPGLESIPTAADTTRRTRMLLDAIARTSPGKPVRYAVISHHHGDHMGGVAEYAKVGATVLVAPSHRRAAERAVATGRKVGTRKVGTVPVHRAIAGGARTVEVWNVGPNPHTDANLCLWVPEAGVLFQGDLFYFQAGAPFPPSGRGTMNRFFARWLEAKGIRPRAVYGVHDEEPAGPEVLAAARALPEPAKTPAGR